ncbi:uncharacterized protein [Periplaneta americana]|uniref:uncharacterized protein isoform X2 n=1 Tax=Periplaneta americana TaxID=6978 RepID=UPI0037E8CCF4
MSLGWYVLFLACLQLQGIAQDCKTPGEECSSDEDCCGGCCKGRLCIQSFGLCSLDEDPCLSHECPPGTVCYLYHPADCLGCSTTPHCKDMETQD